MPHYILLILIFIFSSDLIGQQYTIELSSPDNRIINQWLRDQPRQQDSITWIIARNELLQRLHEEGYLLAEVSNWNFSNDTLHVAVDPGKLIYWSQVTFRALEYLPPHWVQELDMSGEVVDYLSWRAQVASVLNHTQSEGYLFAGYRLNILELKKRFPKSRGCF